jgi:hypothetical protein
MSDRILNRAIRLSILGLIAILSAIAGMFGFQTMLALVSHETTHALSWIGLAVPLAGAAWLLGRFRDDLIA